MTSEEDFASSLLQETIAVSDTEIGGAIRAEVFTRLVAARLEVAQLLEDPEAVYFRARGVEVSGYALDEDPSVMHLFVTDYRGTRELQSLHNTAINQSFARLREFVERCFRGFANSLEETSAAYDLALLLQERSSDLRELRLYLISDAKVREPKIEEVQCLGLKTFYSLWDFERIRRHDSSGETRAPISIDFSASAFHAECVPGPLTSDHQVFLLILPGQFVANIYDVHGPRLLERNVRAFLQARGAVNKGIRETLLRQPERFLAYNNGLSATASRVERSADGQIILNASDFQIVNGGQTTATLHYVLTRDRADLTAAFVQMKMTVVSEDMVDQLVPYIAQYSNTQNRVTGADLSSNDAFLVKLEGLSRTIWAPPRDGAQRQTRWFFERARGQYADEVGRQRTDARRRQFRAMNPANQRFTKLDVAKVEHVWAELPHVVCLGGEKNFQAYLNRLEIEGAPEVDTPYFKHLVAMILVFRAVERVVSEQPWYGGYRANIVPYAIAKMNSVPDWEFDLDDVWLNQGLSGTACIRVAEVAGLVWRELSDPPSTVRNIGEWSKKLDCWLRVLTTPID